MRINNVQPITPHLPTIGVMLVNEFCSNPPKHITNGAVMSTAPFVPSSENSFAKLLPSHTLSALVSQHAVYNNNLSPEEKLKKGVITGSAVGATLSQLAGPGNILKPGVDEFIMKLKNKTPTLPDKKILSNAVFTGDMGVKSLDSLKTNTSAQVTSVTNAMQKATTELTNKGVITGKESPTQISGVVMAAAAVGAGAVANLLSNPGSLASTLSSNSDIGKLIAGGNFAGNLADKFSSPGLASSVEAFASNAAKQLGAGVTGLLAGASSLGQKAFALAEKSFGTLKAGAANFLKGATGLSSSSNPLNAVTSVEKAVEEKLSAEKALNQAKNLYKATGSPDSLAALREAETKFAGMEQQVKKLSSSLASGGAAALAGIGAQQVGQIASAANNLLPNSSNTGSNVFPAGIATFANVVQTNVSTAFSNVKNLVQGIPGGITSLAGNLKNNLTNMATNAAPGAGAVTTTVQTLTGQSPAGAIQNIATTLKAGPVALLSSAAAMVGGIGGKLKLPSLGEDTFAQVKVAMESTLNKTLDPKVPIPNFNEITAFKAKGIPAKQAAVQAASDKIEELRVKRKLKTDELGKAITKDIEYASKHSSPDASLINNITKIHSEIAEIDKKFKSAQDDYMNSLRA